MESTIFFGGSVVASVVAGTIALFAPCCISVMLPAYFAGSFQNRTVLVAMTFMFAAGVATVILPLVLGVSLLRQLVLGQHTLVYVVGGVLMLGLGIYTLLGGKLELPTPGHRAGSGRAGPLGVYSLGLFSGVASSCCAPVLAGVIALSSVVPTLGLAFGLGAAYVFGMVAPLFVIALLWSSHDWRRLFQLKPITWRIGALKRTLPVAMLASGVLLVSMGVATIWVGFTSDAMATSSYWAMLIAVRLQQAGQATTDALAWVPNWLAATVLVIGVALLAWRALSQLRAYDRGSRQDPSSAHGDAE